MLHLARRIVFRSYPSPSHQFPPKSMFNFQAKFRKIGPITNSSVLDQIDVDPQFLDGVNDRQLEPIDEIARVRYLKPSPKLVDLRFTMRLPFRSLYFVILVGKERRKDKRHYGLRKAEEIGNFVAAAFILLAVNSFVSIIFFGILYLIKSWLGINLLKKMHLIDVIHNVLALASSSH
jgi:hypothetical protein